MKMKKIDIRRRRTLRKVLSVQSESGKEGRVRQSVLMRLENIKNSLPEKEQSDFIVTQKEGNIFVTKGKLKRKEKYPCVVAHTDTVHDFHDKFEVKEHDGWLFAFGGDEVEQKGIGGDDKVGVFIALEMIATHAVIKGVFFAEEEIGLLGSGRAPKSFFKDCGFALQCDRKGNKDFVNEIGSVKLYSDKFSDVIAPILKHYGYKETTGGSTDVTNVKEKADICVANMSCGYFEPHTDKEVVHIESVFQCANMVSDIIKEAGQRMWRHKYKRVQNQIRTIGNSKSEYWGGGWAGGYYHNNFTCSACNSEKDWSAIDAKYVCNTSDCIDNPGRTVIARIEPDKKEEDFVDGNIDSECCPLCSDDALTPLNRDTYWCTNCWTEVSEDDITAKDKLVCKCGDEASFTYFDHVEKRYWCINCDSYLANGSESKLQKK